MHRIFLAVAVVLACAASLSAQVGTARAEDQILISHGSLNYILSITQDGFYLGEPAVSVQAEALTGTTLRASRFAVRGWRERDQIRVVVYAVVTDPQATSKTIDTAIATYVLKFGTSVAVRITETAEWGGRADRPTSGSTAPLTPLRHQRFLRPEPSDLRSLNLFRGLPHSLQK